MRGVPYSVLISRGDYPRGRFLGSGFFLGGGRYLNRAVFLR
jgi:hypothetical protein